MVIFREIKTTLKNSKRDIFILTARLLIGSLFILSSLPKIRQPYEFLSNVYDYEMVGQWTGVLIAMVLPWLELIIGICLLSGLLLSGAFLTAALLGVAFTLAQASALYRGLGISCGCFISTAGKETVSYFTLLRAGLVLAVALASYLVFTMQASFRGKRKLDVVQ